MTRHKPPKRRTKATDRKLRERVFDRLANPEIGGEIAVANMQMQFEWVKSGKVPGPPKLAVVGGKEASA